MNMESLKKIALQSELIHLADTYIPYANGEGSNQKHKDVWESKLHHLEDGEFLIPVLGIQGTGKSSLLNALFMNDIVLPVDADETTCIPVEIRYGRHNDGEVHVHFEGKDTIERFYDKSRMEQFVHQRFNPGNEKQVSHIVVYKDDELLRNQIVFVDLPGVGSMTVRNVELTMNYIKKLSAAIFLLRTVPPITRSERMFLKQAWASLSSAWFIQNRWNDESEQEAADGEEHNMEIIQDIAAQTNIKAPERIRIINIYQGLNAKLQQDTVAYQTSGMQEFRSMLEEITANWKMLLIEQCKEQLRYLLVAIHDKVIQRQQELRLSTAELRDKYAAEEQEFYEATRRNKNRIDGFSRKMDDHRILMSEYAQTISQQQTENLRSEMRRVIGGGVVDGQLLNRAFVEIRDSLMMSVMEDFSLKLDEIQQEIAVLIENLEIQKFDEKFDQSSNFHKSEALKFEKAIPLTTSIGGSLIGLHIGAKVGTLVAGPIGTVIGGVAGASIALLFSFLGIQAKKKVVEFRQKLTLQDLEQPLRDFRHMLQTHLETSCDTLFKRLDQELRQFKKIQDELFRNDRNMHDEVLQKSEAENEQYRKQLEQDLSYIHHLEGQLI
ncbi:dynamin family protein [Paenibacillus wenxiniae]|uniref:Dynamin family protein n=1 Tax=Paenibacillus wenxiniae TaxID=1636843 RepID=A0ABW4RH08_9BACL